jgi:NADH-quinone oxidoreductase subunit N
MKIVAATGTASASFPFYIAAIFSIFVGSFAAINQTKIKRLLAYSAIAHVGFMLLGLGVGTFAGLHATIVYMIIYIILTLNTFSIVLNQKYEFIAQFRGLSRHNPILAITFGLGLMSIAGVPPLAGFYNKYLIILSTIQQSDIIYAVIAIILSVISSFYYVRIIRYMFFVDNPELTVQPEKVTPSIAIILGITTYFLISLLIFPSLLLDISI